MQLGLYLILLFPLLLVIFDSLCRLFFLVVVQLPEGRVQPAPGGDGDLRLLVLVVAHDEADTIERTIRLLAGETAKEPGSRIAVLADHCSDQTAAIAARAGAGVYARNDGLSGKSQALSWLVLRHDSDLAAGADIIAVLDADTLVEAGFCHRLRDAFRPGVDVVQGYVNPVSRDGFPLTTLVSLSEILSERIDDAARSRLRWSVPLRGTAMAFRTSVFMDACRQLGTQVDDIELSVRLAESGILVHFDPDVRVDDPKSDRVLGLARQRGRWLKGQRQVWKTNGRSILKLLRSRPPNWSLIQAMLLKPKTALVFIRLVMLGLLWTSPFARTTFHSIMVGAIAGSLLIDAVYYLSGLKFASDPARYLVSLLISPALIVLWAISWAYSLLPTQEWLRAKSRQ